MKVFPSLSSRIDRKWHADFEQAAAGAYTRRVGLQRSADSLWVLVPLCAHQALPSSSSSAYTNWGSPTPRKHKFIITGKCVAAVTIPVCDTDVAPAFQKERSRAKLVTCFFPVLFFYFSQPCDLVPLRDLQSCVFPPYIFHVLAFSTPAFCGVFSNPLPRWVPGMEALTDARK